MSSHAPSTHFADVSFFSRQSSLRKRHSSADCEPVSIVSLLILFSFLISPFAYSCVFLAVSAVLLSDISGNLLVSSSIAMLLLSLVESGGVVVLSLYSHFMVGSLLRLDDSVILGINMTESTPMMLNVAFFSSSCAKTSQLADHSTSNVLIGEKTSDNVIWTFIAE